MSSASSPIGRSQPDTSHVLSSHLWYTHPPSDDEFDIHVNSPSLKRRQQHQDEFDIPVNSPSVKRRKQHQDNLTASKHSVLSPSSSPCVVRGSPNTQMLNGKFLTLQMLYKLVCEETPECSAIPPGKKDNTYFVLDNSLNVRSRKAGGINDFTDDCGVWNRKSTLTKRTDFIIVNNKLSCMKMNQGRYCNIVKGHLVLLDPQPAVEEIVIMKRFYSTLKRDSKFKKRVTWFEKLPNQDIPKLNIAIVEYIGILPESVSIHGNRKKNDCEYIRTSTSIRNNIKEKVVNAPPRRVYSDIVIENPNAAPRNLKQVQNAKQAVNSSKNPVKHKSNPADDMQAVINMIHESLFVQEIIQVKGKPPCIILYTDEQLKDLTNICSNSSSRSILGIDRTFNLGSCFVTSFV